MRLYVDTNVYLYYIGFNEGYGFIDYKEISTRFFAKVLDKNYEVVLSDWVKEELIKVLKRENLDLSVFAELFTNLNIVPFSYTYEDIDLSKKLNSHNWQDMLHIILAKKSNSLIIITENKRDFKNYVKNIDLKNIREFLKL